MPALADTLDQLDAPWFTQAFREGGALNGSASVAAAQARLFGTGQFGLVAQVALEYDGAAAAAPASVIVKLPSADEGSRQLGIAIGAYEAEVRFYKEVLPRVDVAAPRVYWGGVEPGTGRVTLVLEDLSSTWEVGDAVTGGTLEQAAAALEQLVRLQAPLWDHPTLPELGWLSSPARTKVLFDIVAPALPAFRERLGPRLAPEQMELVERLAPKAGEYPGRAWTGPLVVMHGDYRLDNLLFAERNGSLEATVIDWQSVRLGPPLVDAGIYLSSCLAPDQRRAHQEELLRGYHEGLVAAGVRDFSFEDCMESYRRGSLYTFLLGIGVSVTLERTERGDAMFATLVGQSADLVAELDAAEFLD